MKSYAHRSTGNQGGGTNEPWCTLPYHPQRNNTRNTSIVLRSIYVHPKKKDSEKIDAPPYRSVRQQPQLFDLANRIARRIPDHGDDDPTKEGVNGLLEASHGGTPSRQRGGGGSRPQERQQIKTCKVRYGLPFFFVHDANKSVKSFVLRIALIYIYIYVLCV